MNAAINTYHRWLKQSNRNTADDWIAHFNLGILLRDAGHTEKAINALRAALRQKPDFTLAKLAITQIITN